MLRFPDSRVAVSADSAALVVLAASVLPVVLQLMLRLRARLPRVASVVAALVAWL